MPSHWAKAHGGRAIRPRVGEATPPHPYKPLGLLKGPLPHRQETFCLYQELGPSRHFPLVAGTRSPKQLHNNITSLYDVQCIQATTSSSSTLCIHANGFLTCSIWASIEEVMPVQTLTVPGATPRPLLYQGVVRRQHPTEIAITPSSHLRLRCS